MSSSSNSLRRSFLVFQLLSFSNASYIFKAFPLVLRKWKKGDVFFPFGMKGKKTVSKYYKDEKMSFFDKQNQWLLCNNDEIVWVVGKRPDRRFFKNNNASLKIEVL